MTLRDAQRWVMLHSLRNVTRRYTTFTWRYRDVTNLIVDPKKNYVHTYRTWYYQSRILQDWSWGKALHSNPSGSTLLDAGGLLCFSGERPICYVCVWAVQLKVQCRPIMPILVKSPANDTTLWLWHIWILCTPNPIGHVVRRTLEKSYDERPIVHSWPDYAKLCIIH